MATGVGPASRYPLVLMRHRRSASLACAALALALGCGGARPHLPGPPPNPNDRGRVVAPCTAAPVTAGLRVSGHVITFGPGGVDRRLPDAVVRSLEHPERCTVTARDGAFSLGGFAPGERVTLTMDHLGFTPIQTGTHVVPERGIERLTFQAPVWEIYHVVAMTSLIHPRPGRCQIASTVTQVGHDLYDDAPSHGEPGATVTISPQPSDMTGPVYFQYVNADIIVPDPHLRETTRDGGVLFLNVPPGEYVLTAHKNGVRFTEVRAVCRAGVLVNASPPWGLQALPPEAS